MTEDFENFPGRRYDRDEIMAETDPENVKAIMEDLSARVKFIESQLEFRTEAEPDWEARAIAALAANRILYGVAGKRYHEISGRKAGNLSAQAELKVAKEMKRQNNLEAEKLARENKLAKAEKARIGAVENAIRAINAGRFQRSFWQVAREQLPPDVFSRISSEAEHRVDRATADYLRQAGLAEILRESRKHDSDCSVHNMPALPNQPCDCGIAEPAQ